MLPQMSDAVAALVLRDNYFQTQSLSIAGRLGVTLIDQQARFIRFLERTGRLNRALEFLPTDDEIQERKARAVGLTSPEMATLLAYSKMWLSDELMASDLPEDPWIATESLERYFRRCCARSSAPIPRHPLSARSSSRMLNSMVNRVGSTFAPTRIDRREAGARRARLFGHARVLGYVPLWQQIEALDNCCATP